MTDDLRRTLRHRRRPDDVRLRAAVADMEEAMTGTLLIILAAAIGTSIGLIYLCACLDERDERDGEWK